jgi:hypothetical protein
MLNNSVSEYIKIGDGVGSGFLNTNELHMMSTRKLLQAQTAKMESQS